MSMTAPELTTLQKAMFDALGLDSYSNLALVSVVEKATGKHRALIMGIGNDGESVTFEPVAMLLDDDNDIDLFEPPSTDVEVHEA